MQTIYVSMLTAFFFFPFLLREGNPASDSVPVSGDGVPSLSQPSQPCEDNSNSSVAGVAARGLEPPDLADRSSQSSLASLDDAGPSLIKSYKAQCLIRGLQLTVILAINYSADSSDTKYRHVLLIFLFNHLDLFTQYYKYAKRCK